MNWKNIIHTWLVVIFTLRFVIKAELNTLKQMDEKSICKTYFTTGICGYIVYKESKKLRNDEKKKKWLWAKKEKKGNYDTKRKFKLHSTCIQIISIYQYSLE